MIFVAATCFYVGMILKLGVDAQLVRHFYNRSMGGGVDLNTFLSYGGHNNLFKWIELLLGFSIARDYTLYIGILPVFLIILVPLVSLNRKSLLFLLLIILLLLLSSASFLAVFLYHVWPLMKFYRHLSLVSPIVRIFLCFLAGFGFEAIFLKGSLRKLKPIPKYIFVSVLLLLGVLSGYLFWMSSKNQVLPSLFRLMGFSKFEEQSSLLKQYFSFLIKVSSFKIFFVSLLIGMMLWFDGKRFRGVMMGVLLVFHLMDVYAYTFYETKKRTISLDDSQYQHLKFQQMPFVKKRHHGLRKENSRNLILSRSLFAKSSHYWTLDAFLFNDQLGTILPTQHWQRPLDDFMRVYEGQSLTDQLRPKALAGRLLVFPEQHPAAKKFAGLTEDKIQFFSHAYFFNDKEAMAVRMTDQQYAGDILFLLELTDFSHGYSHKAN